MKIDEVVSIQYIYNRWEKYVVKCLLMSLGGAAVKEHETRACLLLIQIARTYPLCKKEYLVTQKIRQDRDIDALIYVLPHLLQERHR